MPWLLVFDDDDDDAEKVISELVDHGQWSRIVGGWMVTPSGDDPKRSSNRARQARYRDRKRNAALRESVTRSNADDEPNFEDLGGEFTHSRPPFGGREGVSEAPERYARNASPRNAPGVTRGNADEGPKRVAYGGPETWRVDPLTEADRELGRAQSAALADRLRKGEL